jgi:excinuclease UvrABC ATPase subunit
MQISELAQSVRGLDVPSVAPMLATLQRTLDSFAEMGLAYLSLDRPSGTLSRGEGQRVKMVHQLGSSLTDVTYVFDEPTTGLHPDDVQRMNDLLLRLRDKGNTVLVVEHEPETTAIADHVVDLGPGAGTAGGTVCFESTFERLRASGTVTGRHLDDRAPQGDGAAAHRHAADPRRDGAQPARRRRRRPARGACRRHRRCRLGQELAGARVDPRRRGRRVDRPGLDPRLATEQPGDVYGTARPDPQGVREGQRAGEARTPAAHRVLDRLADVGLGYLTLGQSLTTLSRGERQRLKLATHMGTPSHPPGVHVLDEPTAGLHLADVDQLLGLLDRLVDSGKSVIVIEHHQAVMAHADWIIDLGPGAGHDGGRIVFDGTPVDLVTARSTLTGEHLAAYVSK